jgi:hypothetical protein
VVVVEEEEKKKNIYLLSSDIEKAYNNVLRTDTWKAVQELNFAPLTLHLRLRHLPMG